MLYILAMSVFILASFMFKMNFGLNSCFFFMDVCFDEVSLFMVYMACFVVYVSCMAALDISSLKVAISLFFMLFICLGVFITNNMFFLYLFYELSLVPIIYIIMKWGSYPERSLSSIMLLVYTSVFTLPFLFVLFSYYSLNGSFLFNFVYNYKSLTLFYSIIVFLTFAVKLPIYGLHFWLPMAHVEAPTFGSMILAGVLLKLGGVGLLRFSLLMNVMSLKFFFLSYFLVFLSYVTLICCFQSDFKRLVAYSSVSHMMTVPVMLFSLSFVGVKGIILVMFFHGISSPLLFFVVGLIYSMTMTRQHILIRGVLLYSPLFSFFMVLGFFFTLSAPPYPSFVSEVFFTLSALMLWEWSVLFVFLFLFFSLVYNLLWLTHSCFLTQSSALNYSFSLTYCHFVLFFLGLFVVPVFSLIVFSFVFFKLSSWGQLGFQEGSSVIMELMNYFHDYMMMILTMIMVFVTYVFLWVIFSKRVDKNITDSHILETIWTIVPMLILCFMAFPSLYLLYLMEDVTSPSLTIKVIGHQWYWEYQYSNSWLNFSFDSYMVQSGVAGLYHALDVDNRLVLPSSVNLLFLVTSADVIHSWTVPSLGVKADCIPGRLNSLITMSMFSGVYYGQCSEICGSNHSYMPVVLEFVPASVYASYMMNLS